MTLTPRVVVVHRTTEYEELLARHGTRGQAEFFLGSRGRRLDGVETRHAMTQEAIAAVMSAVPIDWRRGRVERSDLPRFLFAPEDVILVVGQDGLVANVAKYLDGQPVIGINPAPDRNPGVLVVHSPTSTAALLDAALRPGGDHFLEARTMVEACIDDDQRLLALNEIYVGHASHQTARYTLALPDGRREEQASSGILFSTGTGATGWCRSVWHERASPIRLPEPVEERAAWFAREAWPSAATGTTLTEGVLVNDALRIRAESDLLVAFGDGVEADALPIASGQSVELRIARRKLRLLR